MAETTIAAHGLDADGAAAIQDIRTDQIGKQVMAADSGWIDPRDAPTCRWGLS